LQSSTFDTILRLILNGNETIPAKHQIDAEKWARMASLDTVFAGNHRVAAEELGKHLPYLSRTIGAGHWQLFTTTTKAARKNRFHIPIR
jgi:hypothetical protein